MAKYKLTLGLSDGSEVGSGEFEIPEGKSHNFAIQFNPNSTLLWIPNPSLEGKTINPSFINIPSVKTLDELGLKGQYYLNDFFEAYMKAEGLATLNFNVFIPFVINDGSIAFVESIMVKYYQEKISITCNIIAPILQDGTIKAMAIENCDFDEQVDIAVYQNF